ncbi:nucleoside-specific channel-forming Tsx family protein [Vibrio bivalvicida]|uniref:Outer membrane protein OmpK n=1 Tax=Vibrio bivalvicida TaxID=1276888 RepID=A0ABV4MEM7_9VIBR
MKKNLLLATSIALGCAMPAMAADYSDGIYKNDHRWFKFNYMYANNELPGESNHDYIELEFGGKSGIFDVYGYLDLFNPFDKKSSDKYNEEKMFVKIAPRMSIDGLIGKDLSVGPIKEFFVATELSSGGGGHAVGYSPYSGLVGLGADIEVPFMGVMGWALQAKYDINTRDFNGYQIGTAWFNPLVHFDNGSFIAYQGYGDFSFGMDDSDSANNSATSASMFNGIYWHNNKLSVGYGLKFFKDMYGLKDGGFAGKTTGFGHYFSVGYNF